MHVCAYDVNSRIERYAALLNGLEQPHSIKTPVNGIELTRDEIDRFKRVLDSDIYLLTARRRNYLILRLDSFSTDGAASYDSSLLTIEHVLPQTVQTSSQWEQWWPSPEQRAEWVHRLANLVPLNQRRNSAALNYDFDKKKTAYFGGRNGVSSFVLTTQVLSTASWEPQVIEARQKMLLDLIDEKWELS